METEEIIRTIDEIAEALDLIACEEYDFERWMDSSERYYEER